MKNVIKIACLLVCLAAVIATAPAQNWLPLTPASGNAPAPRSNMAAVYDSLNHRLIIFGGRAASGDLNDVWAFNLRNNSWSDLTPTSGAAPAPRFTANGIYNSPQQQMIIWSGQGAGFFNDVWALDLATNTWMDLTPQNSPAGRWFSTNIYDAANNRAIIFGGGFGGGSVTNEVWAFDLTQNSWEQLSPSGPPPAAREGAAAIYIRAEAHMIIFGGSGNAYFNDVGQARCWPASNSLEWHE